MFSRRVTDFRERSENETLGSLLAQQNAKQLSLCGKQPIRTKTRWFTNNNMPAHLLRALFLFLLRTPFIPFVSSDVADGNLQYQASEGTLESGVGLGLGIFPSTVTPLNQIQQPNSPASSSAIVNQGNNYATIESIRVTGNVATLIHGDGDTINYRVGDTVQVTGNSNVALNTFHIVAVITSSTVFSFVSTAAPGHYMGGTVVRIHVNSDCPAGYYCSGTEHYVCGSAIYYCPANQTRRLSVFRGSNHVGAHYTIGGTAGAHGRTAQVLCPVGHFCVDGIKHKCPAGRYGSRSGEHDPQCEAICRAGYYCPLGSYRADQVPCSIGIGSVLGSVVSAPVIPYCPAGSKLPTLPVHGYYTFGSVKINVVDREDAGSWRALYQYNDSPREVTTNTRSTQCEPGYFCNNGIRKKCRPGFYGNAYGATTDTCSGQCPGGYYCEMGTVVPLPCGSPDVFCPIQSEAPRKVHNGYYSFSHYDTPANNTHSDEHQCELGTYCVDGVRHNCAAGRYGVAFGLKHSNCSGLCAPGYFCPAQSHIRTQHECGGVHLYCPEGSGIPSIAAPGYFTVADEVPVLKHVDNSMKAWSDWKELLFPALRNQSINTNRSRVFSLFEAPDPTHRTRHRILVCPTGNYCIKGRRHLCPPGTYGDTLGLSTDACTAPSPAGHFAPIGTSNETQYPCSDPGYYCPLGSSSPTPVPKGWYSFAPHSYLRDTNTECHRGNLNMSVPDTLCSMYMHNAMYYRLHNDAGYEMYRTTIRMCLPGHFCPGVAGDGHMWEIPPGRVGLSAGISSFEGTGTQNCTRGYYCEAGSTSPTQKRCGSNVLVPQTHEVQVISTASLWSGSYRRERGISGSFVVDFDTSIRSDPLSVQWNRILATTTECEQPCQRRMLYGKEHPPRAIQHDATAMDMKSFLETLPNIGTVNVSRTILSQQDHTFAWSITFVTVLGDVPLLAVRLLPTTIVASTDRVGAAPIVTAVALDAHAQQNRHDHVHHIIRPLAGGVVSVVEQTKGVAAVGEAARGANVYCPTGSGNPTPTDIGYYTNLRNNIYSQVKHVTVLGDGTYEPSNGLSGYDDETAYEQVLCEVGHWCHLGLRDACLRGRYGQTRGLTTEYCSGPCAPGFICPHGSYLPTQLDCGYATKEPTSVYCPPGLRTAQWKPTLVTTGYYTTGGETIKNRTRWAQTICPLGHYCTFGKRIRCPSGKYGGVEGLNTSDCSGNCNPGYFCPQGSWLATQNECGSDYGVRSPCKVKQRDGETQLVAATGERRCEVDHALVRDHVHSQGTGHTSVHPQETEDYTMAQPRQYHYHTTVFHTSRVRFSGEPSAVYCPAGTGVPIQITEGYYTQGGNDTTNRTRHEQLKCPAGYFCEEGKRYQCPPGRFGETRGLRTEFCTGFCPAGFTCPWNTSTPIECARGQYSQAGSMTCTDCPQRPGWSVREESCRNARSCCFT